MACGILDKQSALQKKNISFSIFPFLSKQVIRESVDDIYRFCA